MNVLVFNVGSTTLKYACIDSETEDTIASGLLDRIGQPGGDAINHLIAAEDAIQNVGLQNVHAIGHRIVQGGSLFPEPTVATAEVLTRLKTLDTLAPLHNPSARAVAEGLTKMTAPQVLVFDTSYFASLSPAAYRYAVPEDWYSEHAVRRYGFHGTSHQFVTQKAIDFLGGHEQTKIISLHLGGGASATASIGGRAIDTSMGMTPLEGLVMASRSGDLDPAVVLHMTEHAGLSPSDVRDALNRRSGLFGLCGEPDMRAVLGRRQTGDPAATLAIDIYVRRIVKTIGSYIAVLGGLDALVFTAGVGQHSTEIRAMVCQSLGHFGISICPQKNETCRDDPSDLSSENARVRTLVVATNEELAIARLVRKTLL
ncbi:acetate/propionate family kinase [Rhodopirellula halodulae]|uniref:acetate/propionate family kinase n=1 Tax=Rhodopirellula halodulae TaxID=2894198 RepID=UPI001E583D77|nr:acetate/propionate family kinase [Rhodopirellula sp. JC737]MCC9654511.1 acetate/propionate family kinase [Rhodopirellula sp. JC737]